MTLMKVKFSMYDTEECLFVFKYLWKTEKNVLLKHFLYLKGCDKGTFCLGDVSALFYFKEALLTFVNLLLVLC